MAYKNGLVVVGTSAVLICTPSSVPANGGVLINNQGTVPVFIGGPTVTTSGATAGISVANGATVLVPTTGATTEALWGISGTAAQNVAFLFPG